MKKKQYSEEAKELCRKAGFDPFEVVERPGLHDAPRWIAYLGKAKELAEAVPGPMPQPDGYKGSPLKIIGSHEDVTIDQMKACMSVGNVVGGVICADGHLGYAQPVGGVIAYEKQISISGVGFDIGCGNYAVKLDTPYADIADRLPQILADVRRVISFGVGRTNAETVISDLFDDGEAWRASDMDFYRMKAISQLGTVGSGNHYVDIFHEKADGSTWIGVHFGSRGFGHTTATRYLKAAGGQDGINVPPAVVDEGSEIGTRYIAGMKLAGRYAYAGREWVADRVRRIIGGNIVKGIHNHHNYAWEEIHDGRKLWVVRKGATPAFPGQEGFIGGSMGDDAVIVEGVDCAEAKASLYSTVHGAGRLFGRRKALKTFTREEMDNWLRDKGVIVSGGDLDESPMAYRRLVDVLACHSETIKVNHVLSPVAVAMAGKDEFDPWKD